MTVTTLSIAEVAAQVGLSTDRWRKVWTRYVIDRAFPAPFRRPPASNYAWDPAEVADWKARRARAGLDGAPPANDVHPLDQVRPNNPMPHAVASNPTLQRQRNELAAMMKRGA